MKGGEINKGGEEEIPKIPDLENQNKNIAGILPRKTYHWIEDETITNCYKCNIPFGWYYRKHHCRGCGRIFCYNCISYKILSSNNTVNSSGLICPDKYLEELIYNKKNILLEHKSCLSCQSLYQKIKSVSSIITIIQLLPLEISEIYKLKVLNKTWYEATNIYLSKFREIQYKLPNLSLSKIEYKLLCDNNKSIFRHNRLLCKFIKNYDWDYSMRSIKTINSIIECTNSILNKTYTLYNNECRYFMCDNSCQPLLKDEDILDILLNNEYYYVREYAVNMLNASTIKNYIPLLIYAIRFDDIKNNKYTLRDYLLNYTLNNQEFQQQFYCQLIIYTELPKFSKIYKETLDSLTEIINTYSNQLIINRINRLTFFIKNINKNIIIESINKIEKDKDEKDKVEINKIEKDKVEKDKEDKVEMNKEELNVFKNYFRSLSDKYINVNILNKGEKFISNMIPLDILYIDYDNIKVISSKTAPLLIPYVDSLHNKKYLLYKTEDVRKDYTVLSIIRCMNNILKDNGLDMEILTYDVLPISQNSGLIEIVQNAQTINSIKNKYNRTILNYILEKNPNETVNTLKQRFIKSTASYCIISYLLGIGDRHLDNIMITDDGRLFHIDYSYILGDDCKPLTPKIRLTSDMIDCIGGLDSPYYKEFEEYCITIYNILRANVNIFTLYFNLLTDKFNVNAEIIKRFLVGEYSEQANLQLIKTIEVGHSSYTMIDFLHYHRDILMNSSLTSLTSLNGINSLSPTAWIDNIYNYFN